MKKYTFLTLFSLLALSSKAQTCGAGVNWDSMRVSNPEVYQEHLRIENHTQQFINVARTLRGE